LGKSKRTSGLVSNGTAIGGAGMKMK